MKVFIVGGRVGQRDQTDHLSAVLHRYGEEPVQGHMPFRHTRGLGVVQGRVGKEGLSSVERMAPERGVLTVVTPREGNPHVWTCGFAGFAHHRRQGVTDTIAGGPVDLRNEPVLAAGQILGAGECS